MLHAHPSLALPRETHFVLEAYRRRGRFGDLRIPARRAELVEWIVRRPESQFGRLEVDPDHATARLYAAPPTLGSVLGTAFQLFAERHGKPRWGDKRPLYVEELPAVFDLFPDAQFVSIVRDPRAVIASMKKLGWLDDWYDGTVAGAVVRWMRSVTRGRRGLERLRPDQIREVRYETLVGDPESVLGDLCSFLKLSTEHLDRMVAFHRSETDIPDTQRERYHPRLDQPVTATAIDSWTEVLEPEESAFIERKAARLMELYGYEPRARGVTVPPHLESRFRQFREQRRPRGDRPAAMSDSYPVAARLTTGQRRRYAVARAVRRG